MGAHLHSANLVRSLALLQSSRLSNRLWGFWATLFYTVCTATVSSFLGPLGRLLPVTSNKILLTQRGEAKFFSLGQEKFTISTYSMTTSSSSHLSIVLTLSLTHIQLYLHRNWLFVKYLHGRLRSVITQRNVMKTSANSPLLDCFTTKKR